MRAALEVNQLSRLLTGCAGTCPEGVSCPAGRAAVDPFFIKTAEVQSQTQGPAADM